MWEFFTTLARLLTELFKREQTEREERSQTSADETAEDGDAARAGTVAGAAAYEAAKGAHDATKF